MTIYVRANSSAMDTNPPSNIFFLLATKIFKRIFKYLEKKHHLNVDDAVDLFCLHGSTPLWPFLPMNGIT